MLEVLNHLLGSCGEGHVNLFHILLMSMGALYMVKVLRSKVL